MQSGLFAPRHLLLGFAAGALAVLTFHQLTILAMSAAGLIQGAAYSFQGAPPWGVPRVLNQAFWGGLWGCVFALIAHRLVVHRLPGEPKNWGPKGWLAGFVFGVLGPVLVGWFVVAPIKGLPVAAGWVPGRMVNSVIINGMFGVGLAVIWPILHSRFGAKAGEPGA
jgi:hypothetical protein